MVTKNAAINFLPKHNDDSLAQSGWSVVVDELAKSGHQTVISRGIKAYQPEEGIFDGYGLERQSNGLYAAYKLGEGAVGLSEIGVILDRAGPIRKETGIPTLNTRELRRVGADKLLSHQVASYDFQHRTNEMPVNGGVSDVLHDMPGIEVVLKPRRVLNPSEGVTILEKQEVEQWWAHVSDEDKENGWVIQEKLDMKALPGFIKGRDEQENSKIEEARTRGVIMELRLYCHFSDGHQTEFFPVVRIANDASPIMADEKVWAYPDPDSIPAELVERSSTALSRLANNAAVKDVFSAVDWVYADGSKGVQWYLMETNVRSPDLPVMNEHRRAAIDMRKGLARHLAHILNRQDRDRSSSQKPLTV